jgi:hypothetical protein
VSFAVGQQSDPFSGRVLAAERTEIVRGGEAHVTIHFDAPPDIRRTAVEGTLRVPEAWGRQTQSWRVFLTGISDDPATQGQHAAARITPASPAFSMTFETDPLIEGAYALVLQPLGWKCRVQVTEGMEPLTIDVPVPVEVRIRVTDAKGGGELPEAEVRYSPTMEGEPGWVWRPTTFDERTAEHVCRCPAGRSQFDARLAGYEGWSDTREIPAVDVARILVELRRGGAIRVRFRAEGELLPARGIRVWFSSEREGRSGQARADAVFIDGLSPGAWTVKPKPLAGYRLPAPRTVDVKAGETVEVVFDLELEAD